MKSPSEQLLEGKSIDEIIGSRRLTHRRMHEQDEDLFDLQITMGAVELFDKTNGDASNVDLDTTISMLESEARRTGRSDIRKAIRELKNLQRIKITLPKVSDENIDVVPF